jgi:myosin heavy subunit
MRARFSMILRFGLIILISLVTGCQSISFFRPPAAELDIENRFQQATLFLKGQEYQKAAEMYLRISKEYPQHPRAREAGILGQELQRLVSLNQSLTASKETALKDLKEMTEDFKRLSDQNVKLERFEEENVRLHLELHQQEEQLKGLTSLKQENRRLKSEMDQLKASLKEFHEIEQKMKQPMELPSRSEEVVR